MDIGLVLLVINEPEACLYNLTKIRSHIGLKSIVIIINYDRNSTKTIVECPLK